MLSSNPVESFAEIAERFPGVEHLEPNAIGRFVFHCAGNFPATLYEQECERYGFDERPKWEEQVSHLFIDVHSWRHRQGEKPTRYELSQAVSERLIFNNETEMLTQQLPEISSGEGFERVADYLNKWGFEAELSFAPSPMYPEGRSVLKPLTEFIDFDAHKAEIPYRTRIVRSSLLDEEPLELDEAIKSYIDKGHHVAITREVISNALEALEPIDRLELSRLRELYGAKTANLLLFEKSLQSIYALTGNEGVSQIEIPPFTGVAVDMYDAWESGSDAFTTMLETTREEAVRLASSALGGLVAIRSSAVNSEDGDEHTGAGMYKSEVVDPSDPVAFERAVTSVYGSVMAPNAVAYRTGIGVSTEKMGLLIQSYVENESDTHNRSFGYVNSRGANANLIDAHTPEGTLLYDKRKILPDLLLDRWHIDERDYLHSTPDHSKNLRFMVSSTTPAVHATLLAEKVFGSPIQVEYVGDSLVQVRPLPSRMFEEDGNSVEFPVDVIELASSKAIGIGDVTLERLDSSQDNRQKEGYVVFWSEHRFTDGYNRRHSGVDALPKKGVVIILDHSDSGHIQTLCQERGLLCFYPQAEGDERLSEISDELSPNRYYDDDDEEPTTQPFRFVSDGYDGRIYRAE